MNERTAFDRVNLHRQFATMTPEQYAELNAKRDVVDLSKARTTDEAGYRALFLGRTATAPRPTRVAHPDLHERFLVAAQAGWDAAHDRDTKLAAYTAERQADHDAQRQAEQDRLDAKRTAVAAKAEADLLAPARATWLDNGGDPTRWAEVAPAIADKIREHKAVAAAVPSADSVRSIASTF